MTTDEWKVYWSKRAVKAELALIEAESMLGDEHPVTAKITDYFNEIAKSNVSIPVELEEALITAFDKKRRETKLKVKGA